MKLHELTPEVIFDNKYKMNNIFFKYNLNTVIEERYLMVYQIQDGQMLENISYEIYGDTEYFWILMIINNLNDPIFDIALPDDAIQRTAIERSRNNDGSINHALYSTNYDQLSQENDAKRNIKVIKPEYLNEFLTKIIKLSNNS